jgi:hypothetical protein
MMATAAAILEDCGPLVPAAAMEAAAAAAPPAAAGAPGADGPLPSAGGSALELGGLYSRLKAILLAAAALVRPPPGRPASEAWEWDVCAPLTAAPHGAVDSGALRLCRAVAEALAVGLAASAAAGSGSYASALLLLPLSLPQEAAAAAPDARAAMDSAVNEAQVRRRPDRPARAQPQRP